MISPTDDDHAVSLVFTQRFSIGHFWSPHRITTASIFCKFFINANKSISCKYWVSISSKPLIFIQLGQFRPQYTTITGLRLRVPDKMQALNFQTLAFFFFPFAPRLHYRMGPFMPKSRHFHIPSTKTTLFVDSSRFLAIGFHQWRWGYHCCNSFYFYIKPQQGYMPKDIIPTPPLRWRILFNYDIHQG